MTEPTLQTVERLALKLSPARNRPNGKVAARVFDGLRVLSDFGIRTTIDGMAHWCDLRPVQVDRALKRLIAAGVAERAGPWSPPGRRPVQTYSACVIHDAGQTQAGRP